MSELDKAQSQAQSTFRHWEFTEWDVQYIRAIATHLSNPPEPKDLLPQEIMEDLQQIAVEGAVVIESKGGRKNNIIRLPCGYRIESLPSDMSIMRDSHNPWRPKFVLREQRIESLPSEVHMTMYTLMKQHFIELCTSHYVKHLGTDEFLETVDNITASEVKKISEEKK